MFIILAMLHLMALGALSDCIVGESRGTKINLDHGSGLHRTYQVAQYCYLVLNLSVYIMVR